MVRSRITVGLPNRIIASCILRRHAGSHVVFNPHAIAHLSRIALDVHGIAQQVIGYEASGDYFSMLGRRRIWAASLHRPRMLRQLLTESAIVAVIGGDAAIVAVVLTMIGLVSAALAARRAMRIDPMALLREK